MLRELFRLEEDVVRNPDFADVVKLESPFEAGVVEKCRRNVERQARSVGRDPSRVGAGPAVARFECGGERRDGLSVRLVEQLVLAPPDLDEAVQVSRVRSL